MEEKKYHSMAQKQYDFHVTVC